MEAPSAPMARAGKPQQQAIGGLPFPLSSLPIRPPQAPSQGKNSFPLVPLIQNSGKQRQNPAGRVAMATPRLCCRSPLKSSSRYIL